MIYIIPSPLVDKEDFNLKEKTRGFKEVDAPHFWYLHGALQEKFHYDGAYMFVDYGTWKTDKVQFLDNKSFGTRTYLTPGIHDVVVEGCDKPCRAYIWHQKNGEDTLMRGVVIMISTDKKTGLADLEYATKLYIEKPVAY